MIKTLFVLTLWAILGWLLGEWLGPHIGWGVIALGLTCMILVSGWQLARIGLWVKDIDSPPPPSVGPWDDVLAPIYRKLRKNRQDIVDLEQHFSGMMLAAEALPDGAITLNAAMELMWCNQTAAEHTGLNLATDRGHSIFNILRTPEFTNYARQGSWPAPVLLHLNTDNQEKSLLVKLTPYGKGQFLIVTHDVTQMEKLEVTRKDFVANVSHELRTPLTVLSGFLETMHDLPEESLSHDQRQQYLALMQEQASRMQVIVTDLLTLSALESSPHAQSKPIHMASLIRTALQQGQAMSGGRHQFVVNVTEDLYLEGVESELSSAISNLLTNAINYTPRDGTITVSWFATESGSSCYSVQDTGIGIAMQDIPRLTERFYRVDRGRSRATGGTGLGLAITKHVAMRHDAELKIRSWLGAGSLFSIEFPAARTRYSGS
ncbi:MAG: phosphate regulon sensor histidine kinase PhoR [Burkholderiaceae bacterium]|nr:phosphate regulon sensor histidine kinase PhoR [Burkholderiaceae bacterium]